MAHYFHYLTMINRHIFLFITWCYARFTKVNRNPFWDDYWLDNGVKMQRKFSAILLFIYLNVVWICVRFQYGNPFNLLVHNVVMAIDPMNYLYNFLIPGNYI